MKKLLMFAALSVAAQFAITETSQTVIEKVEKTHFTPSVFSEMKSNWAHPERLKNDFRVRGQVNFMESTYFRAEFSVLHDFRTVKSAKLGTSEFRIVNSNLFEVGGNKVAGYLRSHLAFMEKENRDLKKYNWVQRALLYSDVVVGDFKVTPNAEVLAYSSYAKNSVGNHGRPGTPNKAVGVKPGLSLAYKVSNVLSLGAESFYQYSDLRGDQHSHFIRLAPKVLVTPTEAFILELGLRSEQEVLRMSDYKPTDKTNLIPYLDLTYSL